jgi:hypothetical protein
VRDGGVDNVTRILCGQWQWAISSDAVELFRMQKIRYFSVN